MDHNHWTNVLFSVYGAMSALVLGLLVGQLTFGSISFWGLMIVCFSMLLSFLAGAGVKGSLLVGTTPQMIAGSLLGVFVIAGCLWMVHTFEIVLVVTHHFNLPGEFWIGVSALTGFLGATKWDARPTEGAAKKSIVQCPNCSQQLRLPSEKSGTVSCPCCKHCFTCETSEAVKASDLLIAEPPTLIGRLLGRFTGREWRLYFVEKGKGLQYALHNKGGFQLLGHLHARFNGGKRLSSRWKLYLSHFVGTAEECFELTATMFTASAEFKTLDNRCRSMDRNWDRYGMLWIPYFIHVPTRRRLPLGFSFELAGELDDANIRKHIADRLSGRAEAVTLSTICNDVFVDP